MGSITSFAAAKIGNGGEISGMGLLRKYFVLQA